MSEELKNWIVMVFLVVGFFAVPWNVCWEIDLYCWLRKKYRVKKQRRMYKTMNFIRWQWRGSNLAQVGDKKFYRKQVPRPGRRELGLDQSLRSIDI